MEPYLVSPDECMRLMSRGRRGGGFSRRGGQGDSFKLSKFAGAALWLRADLGVTLNGSNEVTAWADQSNSGDAGRTFTPPGTDKPAWNASDAAYANKPYIGTFNKAGVADDCRLRSGTWSATYSTFTIIVVGHAAGGGGNRYFTHERNADYLAVVGNAASGVVRAYSGAASPFLQTLANPSTPRVLIAEYNGASSKLYVDSFTTPSASGTLAASTLGDAPFFLGSYPLAATTYGVDGIAEVYADFRAFSAWPTEDVRSLGGYINARYGKAIALP